jgi:hypothetical protein
MSVCVLNQGGEVLLHRNLRCDPGGLLAAIAPYREELVVAVECIFTWYWIADLCVEEGIAFVLGHALYMRAIHGTKAKNDRIDSRKTGGLPRGGPRRSVGSLMDGRLGLAESCADETLWRAEVWPAAT